MKIIIPCSRSCQFWSQTDFRSSRWRTIASWELNFLCCSLVRETLCARNRCTTAGLRTWPWILGTNSFQTHLTCAASDLASTFKHPRTKNCYKLNRLCVSALSTPGVCCWSSPLSFGCWFQLLRVAGCHSSSPCFSRYLTLPPPFASVSFSPDAVNPCFWCDCICMPRPATLSVWVTRGGGGDGEQLSWGCTVVFCKCKQLILSLPAGCSAQLSVNRRGIMFIRAHNRCIPLTDSTPPSNQLLLIHFSRSPTFPSAQPLSALSPETGCSLWSNKTETLCRSYLSDPCSPGRRLHI